MVVSGAATECPSSSRPRMRAATASWAREYRRWPPGERCGWRTPELSSERRKAACPPRSSAAWLIVRAGKSGSSSRLSGSGCSATTSSSRCAKGPDPTGRVRPLDAAGSGLDGRVLVLDRPALDLGRYVGTGDLDLAGPRLLGHGDAHGEHAVVVAGLEPLGVEAPAEDELAGIAAVRPLRDGPLGVLELGYRALRGDGEGLPLDRQVDRAGLPAGQPEVGDEVVADLVAVQRHPGERAGRPHPPGELVQQPEGAGGGGERVVGGQHGHGCVNLLWVVLVGSLPERRTSSGN